MLSVLYKKHHSLVGEVMCGHHNNVYLGRTLNEPKFKDSCDRNDAYLISGPLWTSWKCLFPKNKHLEGMVGSSVSHRQGKQGRELTV